MTPKVEFHFDFGSPNAYLAHKVLPAIEGRTGVRFGYLPILLGGVFKLTNNQPPMVQFKDVKAKWTYQRLEIERFIRKQRLTAFRMNPHFPVNTVQIMRGALVAERDGALMPYVDSVFRHMWEEAKKMDDPEVIRAALDASGLDGARILAGAGHQGQAPEEYASLRRPRHLRCAHLLRRRGDLLRQGQAARRGGGDRGGQGARLT
jgi:2-hydroxychromene-2-carboxylate isomerase